MLDFPKDFELYDGVEIIRDADYGDLCLYHGYVFYPVDSDQFLLVSGNDVSLSSNPLSHIDEMVENDDWDEDEDDPWEEDDDSWEEDDDSWDEDLDP